jgi:hypothetical protein
MADRRHRALQNGLDIWVSVARQSCPRYCTFIVPCAALGDAPFALSGLGCASSIWFMAAVEKVTFQNSQKDRVVARFNLETLKL